MSPWPDGSVRSVLVRAAAAARAAGRTRVEPVDVMLGVTQELVDQRLVDARLVELFRRELPPSVGPSPPGHLPPAPATSRMIRRMRERAAEGVVAVRVLAFLVLADPTVAGTVERAWSPEDRQAWVAAAGVAT